MALVVRRWAPTDIPSVQRITWTTWVATYGSFIPESDLRAFFDEHYCAQRLEPYCTSECMRGFLAELDGEAIAFAKAAMNPEEDRFYLHSLYVLPGTQGRGIGSRLLHASEEFAASFGASEVWLGVMTQNTTALDWYRRIGFQFIREEPFSMAHTTVSHLIGFRPITSLSATLAGDHS